MKSSHTENSDKATEHVRLFEVDFNELRCFSFDVFNCLPDVRDLQIRRKRDLPVESIPVKAQNEAPSGPLTLRTAITAFVHHAERAE